MLFNESIELGANPELYLSVLFFSDQWNSLLCFWLQFSLFYHIQLAKSVQESEPRCNVVLMYANQHSSDPRHCNTVQDKTSFIVELVEFKFYRWPYTLPLK
jgi:hypothetical protein